MAVPALRAVVSETSLFVDYQTTQHAHPKTNNSPMHMFPLLVLPHVEILHPIYSTLPHPGFSQIHYRVIPVRPLTRSYWNWKDTGRADANLESNNALMRRWRRQMNTNAQADSHVPSDPPDNETPTDRAHNHLPPTPRPTFHTGFHKRWANIHDVQTHTPSSQRQWIVIVVHKLRVSGVTAAHSTTELPPTPLTTAPPASRVTPSS